jgi:hypothetical protein
MLWNQVLVSFVIDMDERNIHTSEEGSTPASLYEQISDPSITQHPK